MSEYSLFERQETVPSDLGYDYTVVQIEVSWKWIGWASRLSVISLTLRRVRWEHSWETVEVALIHLDGWVCHCVPQCRQSLTVSDTLHRALGRLRELRCWILCSSSIKPAKVSEITGLKWARFCPWHSDTVRKKGKIWVVISGGSSQVA